MSERDDYVVLRSVYNSKRGPLFTSSAYASVYYHQKAPTSAEEIKIRLPDVLNSRHYLKFTVQHVRVNPKQSNGQGWGLLSRQDTNTELYTTVGHCFLALLKSGGNILPDSEYQLNLSPPVEAEGPASPSRFGRGDTLTRISRSDTIDALKSLTGMSTSSSPQPVIKISTKTLSSFVSSCPRVQTLLLSQPAPLGVLPSSILNGLALELERRLGKSDKGKLYDALSTIQQGLGPEVVKHFLVLFRVLVRCLCGGDGVYSEELMNPFAHTPIRCQSFLSLLRIFALASPEGSMNRGNDDEKTGPSTEEGFLIVFLDTVFDEEVATQPLTPVASLESYLKNAATPRVASKTTRLMYVNEGDLAAPDPQGFVEEADASRSLARRERSPGRDKSPGRKTSTADRVRSMESRPAESSKSAEDENSSRASFTRVAAKEVTKAVHSVKYVMNPSFLNADADEKQAYLGYLTGHFSSEAARLLVCQEVDATVARLATELVESLRKGLITQDQIESLWQRNELDICSEKNFKVGDRVLRLPFGSDNSLDGSAGEDQNKDRPVPKVRLPHRHYDTLSGYESRKAYIKQLYSMPTTRISDQMKSSCQWWPWIYEALTYQWVCLLDEVQGSPQVPVPSCASSRPYPSISTGKTPGSRVVEKSPREALRILALDYGPLLLKMIVKSLIMRISRDNKSVPVALDSQTIFVFDRLFSLIAKEVGDKQTSVLSSRRLTISMSHCLRSLFAILVPSQVCRLVSAYFSVARVARQKAESIEANLFMLQELSFYDHIVAVNFPTLLDTPACVRKLMERAKLTLLTAELDVPLVCTSEYRSKFMSSSLDQPPAHWLIELLIYESFRSFRQVERKLQEKSLRLLKDILMRQSYDMRYQSEEARNRLSIMYLPVLREILRETGKLASKAFDSFERKELLPLLLHILENVPSHILREEFRQYCYQRYDTSDAGFKTPESSPVRFSRGPEAPVVDYGAGGPLIVLLMTLLNLVIETFEFGTYSPSHLTLNATGTQHDKRRNNMKSFTAGGTKIVGNDVTSRLDRLEAILHNRGTRKANIAGEKDSGGGEGRKWIKRAEKLAAHASQKNIGVDFNVYNKSVVSLSHGSTTIVVNTLRLIAEECSYQPRGATMLTPVKLDHNTVITAIENCLFTALHGLNCNQTQYAVQHLFTVPQYVIERFGIDLFLAAAGDTLQDWLRTILHKLNLPNEVTVEATQSFLGLLLARVFDKYGSVTVIADVAKAVSADVFDGLAQDCESGPGAAEERVGILLLSLSSMKSDLLAPDDDDANTRLAKKSTALFLGDLEKLFQAMALCKCYVKSPVSYSWDGSDALERSQPDLDNSPPSSPAGIDANTIMETFVRASELFDPVRLPRFRILWLEQLIRFHEEVGSRGNDGAIRLEIFELCRRSETSWADQWAPRRPLTWGKGWS